MFGCTIYLSCHVTLTEFPFVSAEDDLRDVREEVISIKTTYFELGIELGISPGNLETIRRESKSIDQACSKMLLVWLRQDYNVAKHGLPTWQRLVKAVDSPAGGSNSALAKKIAKKHPLIGNNMLFILCV